MGKSVVAMKLNYHRLKPVVSCPEFSLASFEIEAPRG
jgi:hypothetical protein